MPLNIVRNDLTKMKVDVIVNTANPLPIIGTGVDYNIHEKAGPELLKAREKIGSIDVGKAAITPAYNLDAKYVIHAIGPIWQGGNNNEEALLAECYKNALELAKIYKCKSIAFPLISAGNYGFPKQKALQISNQVFKEFLDDNEITIYLVVFEKESFELSEKLYSAVQSYIDENYVEAKTREKAKQLNLNAPRQYSKKPTPAKAPSDIRYSIDIDFEEIQKPKKSKPRKDLADLDESYYSMDRDIHDRRYSELQSDDKSTLKKEEKIKSDRIKPLLFDKSVSTSRVPKFEVADGFSDTLRNYIRESGKPAPEIYKAAGITKAHFAKIMADPYYKPSKGTAISFGIALKLNLEETLDFIATAGFTLSRSSQADLIVEFFIKEKNFDLFEIEIALLDFDQKSLSNKYY